jgi:uncharacterized protein YdhG (YjbR/CyaY superfamily)
MATMHPGVAAYLAALPDDQRALLEDLRRAILAAAPGATEQISYGMPAFKVDGRFLVSYSAFRHHCSLFPASGQVLAMLGAEVEPFFAGKGTLRFTPDRPLPPDLVARIVAIRLEEAAAGRKVRSGPAPVRRTTSS